MQGEMGRLDPTGIDHVADQQRTSDSSGGCVHDASKPARIRRTSHWHLLGKAERRECYRIGHARTV